MDSICGVDDHSGNLDAASILHCLRFLAQEAAVLRLPKTAGLIQDALEAASFESGETEDGHRVPRPRPALH